MLTEPTEEMLSAFWGGVYMGVIVLSAVALWVFAAKLINSSLD